MVQDFFHPKYVPIPRWLSTWSSEHVPTSVEASSVQSSTVETRLLPHAQPNCPLLFGIGKHCNDVQPYTVSSKRPVLPRAADMSVSSQTATLVHVLLSETRICSGASSEPCDKSLHWFDRLKAKRAWGFFRACSTSKVELLLDLIYIGFMPINHFRGDPPLIFMAMPKRG